MSILISASTNPPPIEELQNYIKELDKTKVDYIHCDVMDGKFVSNTTFNHKMLKVIKSETDKLLDVHLMVANPSRVIKKYIKNGAGVITVHFEAYKNKNKLTKDLFKIKKGGAFCGLSIYPSTPVSQILPYIYLCDLLLVMSVVPGKSGQEFINSTYDKLKEIKNFLESEDLDILVEVDGGVNNENIPKLKKLGVNSVVIGNFLYKSTNIADTVENIKKL